MTISRFTSLASFVSLLRFELEGGEAVRGTRERAGKLRHQPQSVIFLALHWEEQFGKYKMTQTQLMRALAEQCEVPNKTPA